MLFWVILGPPWIPKRPRGGTIRLISMYFTCEKCFRVPWTLSGHLLARSSISPSGGVSWTNNLNFAVVKSFWWSTKAKSLSKCKMVLEVYFRPFWAKSKDMFFFFQKIAFFGFSFFFWLFLPDFSYLWTVLDLEHQKWTYSIPLDAKRTAKSQKMGSKADLEFWVLYIP